MRLTSSQRFIASTLFYLLLVAVFLWIFWSLQDRIAKFETSLRATTETIKAMEEKRIHARRMGILLREREKDLTAFANLLVDRERPVALLEELERVARHTENDIAIEVDQTQNVADSELSLRLTLEGKRKSVMQYLQLLELMPYQIAVEDIAFQEIAASNLGKTQKGSTPSAQLLLRIRVKTAPLSS